MSEAAQYEALETTERLAGSSRIAIIIVFFGEWPAWWPYYLHTCEQNPEITWLVFSNRESPIPVPQNVVVEHCTERDIETRAAMMLGPEFRLHKPYKLVDLKPAYGELFQDKLGEFDFWGYTDMDVLYGDLKCWFTDDLLHQYDVITTSDRILAGHLTLIRNDPDNCRLYRIPENYMEVLFDEKAHGYDEQGFNRCMLQLAQNNQLRLFQKNLKEEDILMRLNGRPRFLIVWWKGTLYDITGLRRITHFHFMESKWQEQFRIDEFLESCTTICATPESIRCIAGPLEHALLLMKAVHCVLLATPFYLRTAARPLLRLVRRLRKPSRRQ